jgi:hypothetical protein
LNAPPTRAAVAAALSFVVAAVLISPLFIYVSEFVAVDRCLDSGGSYDYVRGECDDRENHPYIPFRERHELVAAWWPWLLLASSAAVVAGVIFARSAARPNST